jgi:transposase, IS5 family
MSTRAIAATPIPIGFQVFLSGQVRHVTKAIRREMQRRAAIEPAIGHLKSGHWMGRNDLKGRAGGRPDAVLAAGGYSFSLLLRWLEELLRALFAALWLLVLIPRCA